LFTVVEGLAPIFVDAQVGLPIEVNNLIPLVLSRTAGEGIGLNRTVIDDGRSLYLAQRKRMILCEISGVDCSTFGRWNGRIKWGSWIDRLIAI